MNKLPLTTKLLLAIIALLTLVNIIQTALRFAAIYPRLKPVAFNFAGSKFEGLQRYLNNEKYVGYYTDIPVDAPRATLELLQAQHTLVPFILDPNSIDHPYVIVNCSNTAAAIEKFKTLGAQPVTANNFGIILVKRPDIKS